MVRVMGELSIQFSEKVARADCSKDSEVSTPKSYLRNPRFRQVTFLEARFDLQPNAENAMMAGLLVLGFAHVYSLARSSRMPQLHC